MPLFFNSSAYQKMPHLYSRLVAHLHLHPSDTPTVNTMQTNEKKSGINWPKTKKAQIADIETRIDQATSLADVSDVLNAAKAVRMPVHEQVRDTIRAEANRYSHLPGKTRQRILKKERREDREAGGNDMAWDEVNGIASACANMLRVSAGIVPMLSEKELIEQVRNQGNAPLLARLIRAVVADTRKLAADFNKIFEMHKGRSGAVTGDEDIFVAHSIFTDYVNFIELANGNLVPFLAHASEILSEGLNALHKVNPELAAKINYESINYEFLRAKRAMENIVGANNGDQPQEETKEAVNV